MTGRPRRDAVARSATVDTARQALATYRDGVPDGVDMDAWYVMRAGALAACVELLLEVFADEGGVR